MGILAWIKIGAVLAVLAGVVAWHVVAVNRAYDRGQADLRADMEATLARQEKALRDALRKNESLSDPELDCRLKRLRQPGAACP